VKYLIITSYQAACIHAANRWMNYTSQLSLPLPLHLVSIKSLTWRLLIHDHSRIIQ